MKKLLLLLVIPFLTHCGNTSTSSAGSNWFEQVNKRASGLSNANSLSSVSIPKLTSPTLEKNWVNPEFEASSSAYRLTYKHPSKPFNRLLIYGYSKPLPSLNTPPDASGEDMINGELTGINIPQAFRSGRVAGQSVRWFQESTSGGADGAYFTTEGFKLSTADQRHGYFRVVM